jgi:hypothetical protein
MAPILPNVEASGKPGAVQSCDALLVLAQELVRRRVLPGPEVVSIPEAVTVSVARDVPAPGDSSAAAATGRIRRQRRT